MTNLETNIDHFNFLEPLSPQRRAEPPSGGAGRVILWPENNGKKIQTGRKHSDIPTKYANILRYVQKGRENQSTDKTKSQRRNGKGGTHRGE